MATIPVPCSYCDQEVRRGEMDHHLKSCRKARDSRTRAKKKSPPPQQQQQQLPNHDRFGDGQTMRERSRQREGPSSTSDGSRVSCAICGRGFAHDRIAIHQKICRKNNTTKTRRGVFDSTRQRLEGTDMEGGGSFGGPRQRKGKSTSSALKRQSGKRAKMLRRSGNGGNGGGGGGGSGGSSSGKWKQQSSALRDAMRHAKLVTKIERTGGDFSSLPPPPPSQVPSDFIPCPHCGRTFNPQAGERHILACARTVNRPQMLLRGGQRANPNPIQHRSMRTKKSSMRAKKSRSPQGRNGGTSGSGSGSGRSFGAGRVPIPTRRVINRPKWEGGDSDPMSGNGTRFGGSGSGARSHYGGGGSGGGGGGGGGGIGTSNATSANNPLVTNVRQTFDKSRFR